MPENWGNWSAVGRGLRQRFLPTEEDKIKKQLSRLALAKMQADLEAGQEERAMLKKPIYEEPGAYRAAGGILADVYEREGLTKPGYKSPTTWGTLARLKGIGLEPELSERDIKGLGIEGVRQVHKPTYRRRYNLFRTTEGNYVDLPEGSEIPEGWVPAKISPDDIAELFYIEKMKQEEETKQQKEAEGGGGIIPWIQKMLYGKKVAPPAGEKMENFPDPAEYEGKTIRDTETGKRYRSDGTQWQEITSGGGEY